MRMILVACLTLGAASLSFSSIARAEDPYWRTHHEVEWQNRSEFKEAEHRKPEWLREHCIRDWSGHELCRR
jgi:hypothetical protein